MRFPWGEALSGSGTAPRTVSAGPSWLSSFTSPPSNPGLVNQPDLISPPF